MFIVADLVSLSMNRHTLPSLNLRAIMLLIRLCVYPLKRQENNASKIVVC